MMDELEEAAGKKEAITKRRPLHRGKKAGRDRQKKNMVFFKGYIDGTSWDCQWERRREGDEGIRRDRKGGFTRHQSKLLKNQVPRPTCNRQHQARGISKEGLGN